MTVATLKAMGVSGAVAASLLTATPAFAASWEHTVTVTRPNGTVSTQTNSRTCENGSCTANWSRTGFRGRTVEGTRSWSR